MSEQAPNPKGGKGRATPQSGVTALAFFAADHAAEEDGKPYVNGGFFNVICYATFTAIVPTLGIAASLRIPRKAQRQDHRFVITMLDEDRQERSLRIEGAFHTGGHSILGDEESRLINLAGNVTNLVVERPGQYSLVLDVDDRRVADWSLHAVQIPHGNPAETATSASTP